MTEWGELRLTVFGLLNSRPCLKCSVQIIVRWFCWGSGSVVLLSPRCDTEANAVGHDESWDCQVRVSFDWSSLNSCIHCNAFSLTLKLISGIWWWSTTVMINLFLFGPFNLTIRKYTDSEWDEILIFLTASILINPQLYPSSMGMVKTLTLIYKENGVIKGLYRGMSINYLRAIPMVAVSFSTYELMKQSLQLDTGMKI